MSIIKDSIFDQFLISTSIPFATISKNPLDTFENRLKTAIREEVEERVVSVEIFQTKNESFRVGYMTSFGDEFECELEPIPLY